MSCYLIDEVPRNSDGEREEEADEDTIHESFDDEEEDCAPIRSDSESDDLISLSTFCPVVPQRAKYTHTVSGYGKVLVTEKSVERFRKWIHENPGRTVKESLHGNTKPFIAFNTDYPISRITINIENAIYHILDAISVGQPEGRGFKMASGCDIVSVPVSADRLVSDIDCKGEQYFNVISFPEYVVEHKTRDSFQSCLSESVIEKLARYLRTDTYNIYTELRNVTISQSTLPCTVIEVAIEMDGLTVKRERTYPPNSPLTADAASLLPISPDRRFEPVVYIDKHRIPRNLPLISPDQLMKLRAVEQEGIFDLIDMNKRLREDPGIIFRMFYGMSGGSKQGIMLLYEAIDKSDIEDKLKLSADLCLEWKSGTKYPYSSRTAYYLASLDSPREWEARRQRIYAGITTELISAAGSVTNAHCGSFLKKLYGHLYLFEPGLGGGNKGFWHTFEPDGWKKTGEIRLRETLLYTIPNVLRRAASGIDPRDIPKLFQAIKKLEGTGFVESSIRAFAALSVEEGFTNSVDENSDLLNFSNGVWDVSINRMRILVPDDRVMNSTGYPFAKFGLHDPAYQFVRKYFISVYPDKQVRYCAEYAFSSCVYGGNKDKRCYINTGAHDNSKTLMGETLKHVFGSYYIKGDNEELIAHKAGNGNAGGPNPHLVRKKGKRIVMYDELGETQILDAAKIRHLVGCDSFYARTLHKEGGDITPQNKMFISCNRTPKIPNIGEETSKKLRVIPHETTFIKPGDPDFKGITKKAMKRKNLRWMDPEVANTLHKPRYIQAFMFYLIKKYKFFKVSGEPTSDKVNRFTKNYISENDIYETFKKEIIKREPGSMLDATSAFTTFKVWFEQYFAYESRSLLNIISFRSRMSEKLGPLNVVEGGWDGWGMVRVYSNRD